MSQSARAVFLSYASEDVEAALKIAESLHAAAIEMWLDRSELRGGDAWDQKIRGEIRDCALFIPDQAQGYAVRGMIRSRVDWDWTGALTDLKRAVTLSPGDGGVQGRYGSLLGLLGRFSEATAALRTATTLDPLSSNAWDELGMVLMANRDYAGAQQAFARGLEIRPEDPFGLDNLGNLQLITRSPAAALATYRNIGDVPLRDTGIAMAEHSLGDEAESRRALQEAIEMGSQGYASQIADVFAWRMDKDGAFEWLERAHAQHDGGLAELNTDVLLLSLHADPRFNALRRRINLPD